VSQDSSFPESKPVCSHVRPLLGGAVGEDLGVDSPAGLLMDPVVADQEVEDDRDDDADDSAAAHPADRDRESTTAAKTSA
jgi:hypothetical protein